MYSNAELSESAAESSFCGFKKHLMVCPEYPPNKNKGGAELSESAAESSFSGLKRHLRVCPEYPPNKNEGGKKQRTISFEMNEPLQEFDYDVARKNLAKMLIHVEDPFRLVESDAFREFVEYLQPSFVLPSRFEVARDFISLFNEEKFKLRQFFAESKPRVCLTTDIWTSIENLSYMSLTAHYIDDDWKLQKKILNFCPISSHAGDVIGATIEKCLLEWDLKKVLTVTVDNATSNDVAVNFLKKRFQTWNTTILAGNFTHVRCVSHILNLTVRDGLRELSESISRIRSAVRFFKLTPARMQKFKDAVKQESLTWTGEPYLDDETRWNSTFRMIDSAVKYRKAFEFLERNPTYVSKLRDSTGLPTENDWEKASSILPFLKIFYDATMRLSGEYYPTSNDCMLEICKIKIQIDENLQVPPEFKLMAEKMKSKHDKYWGNVRDVNLLLYIAVVLDPRLKMGFAEFIIDECYESDTASKLKEELHATLQSMFEQYRSNTCVEGSAMKDEATSATVNRQDDWLYLRFKRKMEMQGRDCKNSDLEKYLKEAPEDEDGSDFEILTWWKNNGPRYPIVAAMARDVLAIPVSTVSSNSAFSTEGHVLNEFESYLGPGMLEVLMCIRSWFKSRCDEECEESMDEIDELDEALPIVCTDDDLT